MDPSTWLSTSTTVDDCVGDYISVSDSGESGCSLTGALQELPPRNRLRDPPPPKCASITKIPIEILVVIFHLVIPFPRTRENLYDLLLLTHVCRFWRTALINQPRMWSTVFITQEDRRSFVEVCLERSRSAPLDITMEASQVTSVLTGCGCDEDRFGRLLPNGRSPCEWHFQFESLVENGHFNRIRSLAIAFYGGIVSGAGRIRLLLGSCRFFTLSFPGLTTLSWDNQSSDTPEYAEYLFTTPPFLPTLHSLAYAGCWSDMITPVSNLTSFIFEGGIFAKEVDVEDVRLFLLNNQSLESLEFQFVIFNGSPEGPPVHLLNIKSLVTGLASAELSTVMRVPALSRLSSLRVSASQGDYTLRAVGDGITFSTRLGEEFGSVWESLIGYAKPAIRHICLDGDVETGGHHDCSAIFAPMLLDAHILEVGDGYFPSWYDGFVEDLQQLGPQLKILRFAIPEGMELFGGNGGDEEDRDILLGEITELVKYRFEHGRPLSSVERMVVGGDERLNRQQDFVWRCFYRSYMLGQYVQPA